MQGYLTTPVVDLPRGQGVVEPVPGDHHHLNPAQVPGHRHRGGRAPRSLDRDLLTVPEALELVEAAASNDAYFNLHRHYEGARKSEMFMC